MKLGKYIAKFGWLLVVIGFFQPIACDMNGVQIAKELFAKSETTGYGICMWAILIIAIIALLGILFVLLDKKYANDLIFLVPNVICGLIPYFKLMDEDYTQRGATIIFTGWVLVLLASIIDIYINKKFAQQSGGNSGESYGGKNETID